VADRRHRPRKKAVELLVSVRVAEYEREVVALDYHARGVAFWWPAPLPEGSKLGVSIVFAGVQIIDLEAQVRTCRRMGHHYRCGVSFVLPSENEIQTLRKLNAIELRMAVPPEIVESSLSS